MALRSIVTLYMVALSLARGSKPDANRVKRLRLRELRPPGLGRLTQNVQAQGPRLSLSDRWNRGRSDRPRTLRSVLRPGCFSLDGDRAPRASDAIAAFGLR